MTLSLNQNNIIIVGLHEIPWMGCEFYRFLKKSGTENESEMQQAKSWAIYHAMTLSINQNNIIIVGLHEWAANSIDSKNLKLGIFSLNQSWKNLGRRNESEIQQAKSWSIYDAMTLSINQNNIIVGLHEWAAWPASATCQTSCLFVQSRDSSIKCSCLFMKKIKFISLRLY